MMNDSLKRARKEGKGPIVVSSPVMADLICPKCNKSFRYLVTPPKEQYETRSPNSCPECNLTFDDEFYEKIRGHFPCLLFKDSQAWKMFLREFNKRADQKSKRFYCEDKELVKRYENAHLLTIGKESREVVKYGYVNPEIADNRCIYNNRKAS